MREPLVAGHKRMLLHVQMRLACSAARCLEGARKVDGHETALRARLWVRAVQCSVPLGALPVQACI